ncbi:hypothetical protein ACPB9J_33425 [Streptomyces lavendulocolor]|uniref:hypothetical protein n=1 Tax=Streptomyces lavendulocolor TaxID=67316 RepID=UPI003C2FACA7
MNRKQQILRQRTRDQRTQRRALKAIATGTPQTARTHLIATGIDPTTAKRYAPAFSRGITPTTTGETRIKLRGRRTKRVTVKLYDKTTFTDRLITYRPADPNVAARFQQATHRLAA